MNKTVRTSEEFKKVLDDDDGLPLALSRPSSTPADELRASAKELVDKMGILSANPKADAQRAA
jgi:chromosome partitioning protein